VDFEKGALYVGGAVDEEGKRSGDPLVYDSDNFTTHGVIVGMTGSGKTGLGMCLVEEALLSGVPCLVIDPKGDMGNLLLNFPDFRAADFQPWIDEGEAKRQDKTVEQLAAETAETWKTGLADWQIPSERMRHLSDSVGVTIYTPGSTSGVPLNVLGSLAAPEGPFDDDAETHRDEIEAYVSSLLTLAGITADPVSSPEHILVANIIETAWRAGQDMDLASIIGQIQSPPFRKLGVFEIDTFFPPKDRTALALKLNGLVASPSFAAWLEGQPLDVGELLERDGKPQAAVIYLAHLSDAERQFVVTLLMAKVVSWMRKLSGTSELRALIYMDEVFGFCPPTAEPPSKKPMLTILKQARAFGVGMVLSTQNPIDLDYKAMSNAGTWMVGRLQTERDKARILEALQSAAGGVDVADLDRRISGLGKRTFVLTAAKSNQPSVFTTRWAISYLAGPLTKDEVKRLTPGRPTEPKSTPVAAGPAPSGPAEGPSGQVGAQEPAAAAAPITGTDVTGDATPVAPLVAEGVIVSHIARSAPWIETAGGNPAGNRLSPAGIATVNLLYDDTAAGVAHREVFEAVIHPLGPSFDPESLWQVDHDPRDFVALEPGASYVLTDAPLKTKTYWTTLASTLRDHLGAHLKVTVYKCPVLKLYSRVGESQADFEARCAQAAGDAADAEIAKLKDRFETRIERVKGELSAADRRVRELEVDVSGRKQTEVLSTAGDLLGAFLGGRSTGRALSRAASRRSQTRSTQQRLESVAAKVDDKQLELEQLEDELAEAIQAVTDKWDDVAAQIESVDIGLEKTDIRVDPIALGWLPI
jgi:Helicase HerA, central domain